MKVVGYKQSTTVNPITVVATKPVEEVKPIEKSAEKQPTKSTTNKPKQSSTRKK